MSSITKEYFEMEVNKNYFYLINLANYYVHDRYLAEDLVQDAMLKAYKKRGQYHGGSSYKTYLTRILINTIKDHFKKKKFLTVQLKDIITPKKEPSTIDQLIQSERKKAIFEAVSKLDQIYKEVFILRDILEYTYEEISEVLALPLGTVKTRISRARKKVLETIDEEVLLND